MSYWDTEIGPGKRTIEQFRKSLNSVYESRRYIAERLKEIKPTTVLDVGCGPGEDYRLYRRLQLPFSYWGVDSCRQFIEENKREFPDGNFEVGDIRSLRFEDGGFHTVICRSVLEHLPDPYPAIQEMGRVAKERIFVTWHIPPGSVDRLHRGRKTNLWTNAYSNSRIKAVLYDCRLKLMARTEVHTNEVWEIVHA